MQTAQILAPRPLWQSAEMAAALSLLGVDALMGRVGAGSALIVRRRFGPFELSMTSRGPIFPEFAPDDQITQTLALHGPRLVTADTIPTQTLRRAGYVRLRKGRNVALLNTAPDVETQLAQARPKWRNAARQGLRLTGTPRIAPFDTVRDGWLLTKDCEAQRARRYSALPQALIHAYAAAAPGQVHIASIGQTAGLLFLVHGEMATWHLGWTGPEGRRTRAHHALLVQAAVRLWSDGVRVIDLGLAGPPIPAGIAAFKEGTGARVIRTSGSWFKWRPRALARLAGPPAGQKTNRQS